jgi:hypothetical protein
MKNDPAPPPAPDPTQTANAQSNANIQTAIANARLNRVNQQTPWGSITYEQGTPDANGVPTWSSHIQLSPEQQQLLTQQQQMQLQRNGMAGQFLGQVPTAPLDFGSLPGVNVRGQMWNGNTPHAGTAPAGGSMPAGGMPQSQGGSMLEALRAQLGTAGQPGGQPTAPPPMAPPPGAPPPAQNGQPAAPHPMSTPAFTPRYEDYLGSAPGLNASENPTQPMSREQWDALPDAAKWGLLGYGSQGLSVSQQSGDPRYQGLADSVGGGDNHSVLVMPGTFDSNVNNKGVPRFNDPSHVHQGDGYYATPSSNATAASQQQGGMSDLQWAIFVASLFGGGALAGSGAGAGMDAIQAGENVGTMGPGGAVASGGSAGYEPFEANYPGNAPIGEGGAPVTDLSTSAQQPSLWRQALNNYQSGRGLLGSRQRSAPEQRRCLSSCAPAAHAPREVAGDDEQHAATAGCARGLRPLPTNDARGRAISCRFGSTCSAPCGHSDHATAERLELLLGLRCRASGGRLPRARSGLVRR